MKPTQGAPHSSQRHIGQPRTVGVAAHSPQAWRQVAEALAAAEHSDHGLFAQRFFELLAGPKLSIPLLVSGVTAPQMPWQVRHSWLCSPADSALALPGADDATYELSGLNRGESAADDRPHSTGPVAVLERLLAMNDAARQPFTRLVLRCDHPDAEAFVARATHADSAPGLQWALSVTEECWRGWAGRRTPRLAVGETPDLWEQLIQAAYDGRPVSLHFIDRMQRDCNLHAQETVIGAAAGGSIPLPDGGACLQGVLNLSAFVTEAFEPGAWWRFQALEEAIKYSVRLMDNLIDISIKNHHPYAQDLRRYRRLALGVCGLADALAMLGHRYDSWTARGVAEEIFHFIGETAYRASMDLAMERGSFPGFVPEAHLTSAFIRRLPPPLRQRLANSGIRHSQLLAISETTFRSGRDGAVTPGLGPLPATGVLTGFAPTLWRQLYADAPAPFALVDASQLDPVAQLTLQAAVQPWIDQSIQATVRVPPNTSLEGVRSLFDLAHSLGLKTLCLVRERPALDVKA